MALQRKDCTELAVLTSNFPNDIKYNLQLLPDLCGDLGVLEQAHQKLKNPPIKVKHALDELLQIANQICTRFNLPLHFDLAEVRGFNYYTGLMFAVFVPQLGQALAQGGRYDGIGQAFGKSRPATGFSADLKTLVTLSTRVYQNQNCKIWAEFKDDQFLWQAICSLRKQGKCVIQTYFEQEAKILGCSQKLVQVDGSWQLISI